MKTWTVSYAPAQLTEWFFLEDWSFFEEQQVARAEPFSFEDALKMVNDFRTADRMDGEHFIYRLTNTETGQTIIL